MCECLYTKKRTNFDECLFFLFSFLFLQPEPYDNLGTNVCKLCAEKVYAFYEFRLSYLESEKKLREMLHNFEMNQRLSSDAACSLSNANDHSAQFQFDKSFEAETATSTATDRYDCDECGRCFERELELRIHSHTHRTVDTPSQHDSQNGFDEQFLLANIKSEPVEYDLDPMEINPMEWAEVSQSDVDNLLMGENGAGGDNGIGDDSNGELRWRCTICNERFLRRAYLRAHRRQHAIDGDSLRAIKIQNRTKKPTHDKTQNKDQIQIKSIPQLNHDNNSSSSCSNSFNASTTMPKKKKPPPPQQQQELPPPALPTPPPPIGDLQLPSLSLLPALQLNLTADAQYDRWQCKKCFLTFRTRRLLRTHNMAHRNASVTSINDFDASLLSSLAAGNESSSQMLFDHSDMSSFAVSMTAEDQSMPNVSPAVIMAASPAPARKPVQQSPKSHSTPLKSGDGRWKCPKCRKVFETPKALRKHKLSHHTFEIKLNLKSKNFVSDKKNVSFDMATNSAKKRSNANNAIGAPRGHVQRDWNCNSCHQVFSRRSILREHRRTAHMLKPTALPMSIMKQEMENFTAEEFTVAD